MLFYKGVDPTQANLLKIPGSKRRSKLFRTFPNSAFFNKLFEFCGKLQISGKYLFFWRKNIDLKFKVAKT